MIRVRQVKVRIEKNNNEEIKKQVAVKIRTNISAIHNIKIQKKSIDARKKNEIYYVYEVDVKIDNEQFILKSINTNDVLVTPDETYKPDIMGIKEMKHRPIIVGSGPAGLFSAYLLALYGYNPIVIERGECVDDRVKSVETFWETGILNVNSNVQFGEGGAGTFSDGKLNTLVKDKEFRMKKVFEIFVEHGAPKDIMYENKPHIGTDILREVVISMRNKIIENGGEFRYNTCLTDLIVKNNTIEAIEVNSKEIIPCETLILAIGHSARDTFKMLLQHNLIMKPKPFALGIRIMHPQEMINISQYGTMHKYLPPASYKLTYTTKKKRGVYSFCMCPGGYVVNASSEDKRLAINGMSNRNRDTQNANSAIVVTVSPNDYGIAPLDGIEFQRRLEEKAYEVGKGKIPIQLLKDFNDNCPSTKLGDVEPIFKGNYTLSNINEIYPSYITEAIKEAISVFGTKIKGYDREDAIVAGIESRTSSPVCIKRDEEFISNIKGIYPCGEGAGYAGGITTSAMDGMKVAEAIMKVYQPSEKIND